MMDNNIDLLYKRMDILKKRMERVNEKINNLIVSIKTSLSNMHYYFIS